ncbi:hypothetical protein M5X00_29415 [Paenibacillus alvei]|uniref:Uncharacterized protein n=1 Tax=Paenibacillus alvei TaxID=44250 RepID=A0ABT4H861_PAEAL|nr:hypothetical protein [Paenibacillus alvei]MCY9539158.1 hypothetical protein [Paenibacillus alvei]MCY9758339.1 hypothetical protein [Paenibacillus alvei]MCY9764938.1 hypothetical protein [Paenibacillus alvei]MCY9771219.1 hypothetical protein [Paenibacillus alvei]MEC0082935.1 hypothetical protein [Paenibacillus alvei]
MERKREDLIGQTGSITRRIEIVDAKESEHGVSIRISDSMGNVYWTDLDEEISLD